MMVTILCTCMTGVMLMYQQRVSQAGVILLLLRPGFTGSIMLLRPSIS